MLKVIIYFVFLSLSVFAAEADFYDEEEEIAALFGKDHENIIVTVFDWDDTLLPTRWLIDKGYIRPRGEGLTPEGHLFKLPSALEASILRLIEAAQKKSTEVYIITNANLQWVDESSRAFFSPALAAKIAYIPTISARSDNEIAYPKNLAKWKPMSFGKLLHEIQDRYPLMPVEIISIGDSEHEQRAAQRLRKVPEVVVKTIKLAPGSSCEDLTNQLDAVRFDTVIAREGHFDWVLNANYEPN